VLTIAANLFSHFEFCRVIDDHLQAENRTGFVVHLDPVLLHPVFDANAGKTFDGEIHQVTDDVALKSSTECTSKKAHDLLGAKAQCAVVE
jgi:hypothetical protein